MSVHDLRDTLAYRRLLGEKLKFWERVFLGAMNWYYNLHWPKRDKGAKALRDAKRLLKKLNMLER